MPDPKHPPRKHTNSDPESLLRETSTWPGLDYEDQFWTGTPISSTPGSGRSRRTSGPYRSAVPSFIEQRMVDLPAARLATVEDASTEIARFDAELGTEVAPFATILLRSEAVASSQIENLTASARSILAAELGVGAHRNAQIITRNGLAMRTALSVSDELSTESVRAMHRVLMETDEKHTPGQWRTDPVWISTSGFSPLDATYVAPHESRVPSLMEDVMAFARRDDIPILAHIAITHAQFETIHPFSDGNGRTGRALMQAMMRSKGLTRRVTVPISAGLLADLDTYHGALTDYRRGTIDSIVNVTAEAALRALHNARRLVTDVRAIRERWANVVKARRDSAVWKVLGIVAQQPVVSAGFLGKQMNMDAANVYRHLALLTDSGILRAKSEYRVGTLWRSDELLAALDAFAERSGRRSS